MGVDKQLTDWSYRWVLLGHSVVCVGCMAAQAASESSGPFMHFIGCRHIEDCSRFPWTELKEIMERIYAGAR